MYTLSKGPVGLLQVRRDSLGPGELRVCDYQPLLALGGEIFRFSCGILQAADLYVPTLLLGLELVLKL
jgi:hypothetical protein